MMIKKIHNYKIIFVFMLSIGLTTEVISQVSVKANLASAALLIPNVGVSFQISSKSALQMDVLASFWNEFPLLKNAPFQINQTFFEYRRFLKADQLGWFFGPNFGYGMFTFQKPKYLVIYDYYDPTASFGPIPMGNTNNYTSGRVMFYGLTFGHSWKFNKKWGLEVFVGGGLTQSWYKGFDNNIRVDNLEEVSYRPFNGSGEVAFYRGGLMLVYKIPAIKSLL